MFSTTDLAVVAWLTANGRMWFATYREAGKTRFKFRRDEALTALVDEFYAPEGHKARNLIRKYRNVRAAAGL